MGSIADHRNAALGGNGSVSDRESAFWAGLAAGGVVPAAPAPSGTNYGVYDRARSVYNLKPAQLRRSRAAMAKAMSGTGYFRKAAIGDSATAGSVVVPGSTDWPSQLRTILGRAGMPSAGSGWVAAYKSSAPDARIVAGAGWGGFSSGSNLLINSTTANPVTFTSTEVGTIVNLIYGRNGGPFTVAIDGGGTVPVVPDGAQAIGTYTVSGLPNTTHTVSVVRTSGIPFIIAFEVLSSTFGVRMYNAAIHGTKASDWALTPGYYFVKDTTSVAFGADLVMLMGELNDATQLTAPATYKASMQSVITALRAPATPPDVLLCTANPASGLDMALYTQALYELADTNDLPLIDFHDRWGPYATANTHGLMQDTVHPGVVGCGDFARGVASVLGVAA